MTSSVPGHVAVTAMDGGSPGWEGSRGIGRAAAGFHSPVGCARGPESAARDPGASGPSGAQGRVRT
jgi:hypothetical protein